MRSKAAIFSHPLHPILIAFPIGLWIAGVIFDLLGTGTQRPFLVSAGFVTILGGCIGAALAAIPGVIDLFGVIPPHSTGRTRGLIHGSLNVLILLLFVVVLWQRGAPATAPSGMLLGLEILGVVLLGVSGWLGGTLVYEHHIGVVNAQAQGGQLVERRLSDFDRPACNQAELAEGQMMLIHVGDERITIARSSEGFFAFGDSCTHQGGPLCDGALAGNIVQCPWHGSQFDVRNGRVVAGPAQRQITTYTLESRKGEIYIVNPRIAGQRRVA